MMEEREWRRIVAKVALQKRESQSIIQLEMLELKSLVVPPHTIWDPPKDMGELQSIIIGQRKQVLR